MKYSILLLLIGTVAFAQNDTNLSVVSAEKVNILYCGMDNTIKIAMPGAKSFKATAKDLELVKIDSIGNYTIHPTSVGKTIIHIDAIMQDNTYKHEEKVFRTLGLPKTTGILDNGEIHSGEFYMTKKQLINSKVNFIFENVSIVQPDPEYGVKNFKIALPVKKDKHRHYLVEGDKMSTEVIEAIGNLKPGSAIFIYNIHISNTANLNIDVPPSSIIVKLTD